MSERDLALKFQSDLYAVINSFERESGLVVREINISHAGCTDYEPYMTRYVCPLFSVNDRWSEKK